MPELSYSYDSVSLNLPEEETFCSALTNSLEGMLLGRFLVGTGMGLGPPVASLYITEVCNWCYAPMPQSLIVCIKY
jgi:MFS family permease